MHPKACTIPRRRPITLPCVIQRESCVRIASSRSSNACAGNAGSKHGNAPYQQLSNRPGIMLPFHGFSDASSGSNFAKNASVGLRRRGTVPHVLSCHHAPRPSRRCRDRRHPEGPMDFLGGTFLSLPKRLSMRLRTFVLWFTLACSGGIATVPETMPGLPVGAGRRSPGAWTDRA